VEIIGISRAELEPLLADAIRDGRTDDAEAIRAELAGRTWQNHNPYAAPPARVPG
jgi:hypothetical protein